MKATYNRDFRQEAIGDALEMVSYFMDEILEQIKEQDEASDDYNNDYPDGDGYHHENHVDKEYDLLEAAVLLDQLSDHEEDDWGLWEGIKDPETAVSCKAAYTYGNAVGWYWSRMIASINEDYEGGILKDMMGEDDPADEGTIRGRIRSAAEDTFR